MLENYNYRKAELLLLEKELFDIAESFNKSTKDFKKYYNLAGEFLDFSNRFSILNLTESDINSWQENLKYSADAYREWQDTLQSAQNIFQQRQAISAEFIRRRDQYNNIIRQLCSSEENREEIVKDVANELQQLQTQIYRSTNVIHQNRLFQGEAKERQQPIMPTAPTKLEAQFPLMSMPTQPQPTPNYNPDIMVTEQENRQLQQNIEVERKETFYLNFRLQTLNNLIMAPQSALPSSSMRQSL